MSDVSQSLAPSHKPRKRAKMANFNQKFDGTGKPPPLEVLPTVPDLNEIELGDRMCKNVPNSHHF